MARFENVKKLGVTTMWVIYACIGLDNTLTFIFT